MNLMEHEVMGAPIGAEAAGEQKQTIEKARTKIIDAAPLMERLKAAIAFGNEKGLPTDELEQVLADIEGMEEYKGDAIECAIKALSEPLQPWEVLVSQAVLPQPEPCEDAVSRAFMCELGATCIAKPDGNGDLIALGRIDMLPSVTPKQRTGKWILIKGSNGNDYHKCSECLHTQEITGVKNYCAVCGAEMIGDTE